jgi:hypothetical protein
MNNARRPSQNLTETLLQINDPYWSKLIGEHLEKYGTEYKFKV